MSILVKTPGPLTTVQDEGRFFHQSSGIRPSGVMDVAAYEAANALVGNENGEAVLEMTFLGATLEFQSAAWFAVTGADMQVKLDGAPVERYRAIRAEAGQTLAFGMAANGCRGYLAVRGGVDVPLVMGSRSTDMSAKLGGFEGRPLKAGDVLPTIPDGGWTPSDLRYDLPVYESAAEVRVPRMKMRFAPMIFLTVSEPNSIRSFSFRAFERVSESSRASSSVRRSPYSAET